MSTLVKVPYSFTGCGCGSSYSCLAYDLRMDNFRRLAKETREGLKIRPKSLDGGSSPGCHSSDQFSTCLGGNSRFVALTWNMDQLDDAFTLKYHIRRGAKFAGDRGHTAAALESSSNGIAGGELGHGEDMARAMGSAGVEQDGFTAGQRGRNGECTNSSVGLVDEEEMARRMVGDATECEGGANACSDFVAGHVADGDGQQTPVYSFADSRLQTASLTQALTSQLGRRLTCGVGSFARISPRVARLNILAGPLGILMALAVAIAGLTTAVRSHMQQLEEAWAEDYCPKCGNQGFEKCDVCGGRGEIQWEGKLYHRDPCPACLGRGSCKCSRCEGLCSKKGGTVIKQTEAKQTGGWRR